MSEWREVNLDEIVKFQRGHDLTVANIKDGNYPVAGSNGVIGYHNQFTTKAPGITLGRSGNSIGIAHYYDRNFWAHNTTLYTTEFISSWPKYVYYFLRNTDLSVLNSGSAIPSLNRNHLNRIRIKVPDLPEQKTIASVLSSLDDKIDLLHRQNKTLEAMAETLFRQWFVEDARDDWEEKSLLDVIELVGGGTPKTSVAEYWSGEIPWLSGGDIASSHKSFVVSSEKKITQDGLKNSSAKLLPMFSTVITARGTVGKYALLSKPMAYSQSNYGIFPKIDNCFFFTYLLINHVVSELHSSAYGSVFDTITTTTFRDIAISIPSEESIKEFNKNISGYFLKKLHCLKQIETLETLRDTLLPKLMSGEVRVDYP